MAPCYDREAVSRLLSASGIGFELTKHKAVYNMAELADVQLPHPDAIAKNLFVRDDKRQAFFLITARGDKRVDLKAFRRANATRPLSLASPEELAALLGLTPGAVSPLGLLNDQERRVAFFLDRDFLLPPAIIGVHPNDNTATLWLKATDLARTIEAHENEVKVGPI